MTKRKHRIDPYVIRTGVDDLIEVLRDAISNGQDTRPILQRFSENFSDEEYTAITKELARLWHEP